MTIVTFRKETEKLTSMCMCPFKNEKAAKAHIEEDAAHWCEFHNAKPLGWKDVDSTDHYVAQLPSGKKAYWQYFTI